MKYQILGTLVGNTGDSHKLSMVMNNSFSVRRGEFVRIMHKERIDEPEVAVLGRVTGIHRTNMLYNAGFGAGVTELELMPGANVTGENLMAQIELVGYRDPVSRQIKIPRRPLDPGVRVETVDFQFLSNFYEFNEQTSLHLGNLVGYERGENTVPVFLDINNNPIDTLFSGTNFLNPGSTDTSGIVISPTENSIEEILSDERMKKLKSATKIRMVSILNTGIDGTENVKIRMQDEVSASIYIQTAISF